MSDTLSSKQRGSEWRQVRNAIGSHQLDDEPMADSLAIALCTCFEGHMDRPVPDPQTENGWGQWAEAHADRVMDELADLAFREVRRAVETDDKRDAERYRWLRRRIPSTIIARIEGKSRDELRDERPEKMDELVDTRMGRSVNGGAE